MKYKQIPEQDLIENAWYVGRGRNANVAKWDGFCFLVLGEQGYRMAVDSNQWDSVPKIKMEEYWAKEGGTFQPFLRIDEGVNIEPIADETSYAATLEFLPSS